MAVRVMKGAWRQLEKRIMRGGSDLHDMGENDWITLSRAMVFKLSYEGWMKVNQVKGVRGGGAKREGWKRIKGWDSEEDSFQKKKQYE